MTAVQITTGHLTSFLYAERVHHAIKPVFLMYHLDDWSIPGQRGRFLLELHAKWGKEMRVIGGQVFPDGLSDGFGVDACRLGDNRILFLHICHECRAELDQELVPDIGGMYNLPRNDGCVTSRECFHNDTEAAAGVAGLHASSNRLIAVFVVASLVSFAGKDRCEFKYAAHSDDVEQSIRSGDVGHVRISDCC